MYTLKLTALESAQILCLWMSWRFVPRASKSKGLNLGVLNSIRYELFQSHWHVPMDEDQSEQAGLLRPGEVSGAPGVAHGNAEPWNGKGGE